MRNGVSTDERIRSSSTGTSSKPSILIDRRTWIPPRRRTFNKRVHIGNRNEDLDFITAQVTKKDPPAPSTLPFQSNFSFRSHELISTGIPLPLVRRSSCRRCSATVPEVEVLSLRRLVAFDKYSTTYSSTTISSRHIRAVFIHGWLVGWLTGWPGLAATIPFDKNINLLRFKLPAVCSRGSGGHGVVVFRDKWTRIHRLVAWWHSQGDGRERHRSQTVLRGVQKDFVVTSRLDGSYSSTETSDMSLIKLLLPRLLAAMSIHAMLRGFIGPL